MSLLVRGFSVEIRECGVERHLQSNSSFPHEIRSILPMKFNRLPLRAALASLAFFCLTLNTHAQATRTWVSGVGDDVNPGSRTAPCKTFSGAYSKTAAAGEINVLDPGGFGTMAIAKSITIDGQG